MYQVAPIFKKPHQVATKLRTKLLKPEKKNTAHGRTIYIPKSIVDVILKRILKRNRARKKVLAGQIDL